VIWLVATLVFAIIITFPFHAFFLAISGLAVFVVVVHAFHQFALPGASDSWPASPRALDLLRVDPLVFFVILYRVLMEAGLVIVELQQGVLMLEVVEVVLRKMPVHD